MGEKKECSKTFEESFHPSKKIFLWKSKTLLCLHNVLIHLKRSVEGAAAVSTFALPPTACDSNRNDGGQAINS
ncbi:unnamed protein product [Cyprideis torosa]|uniref:Uncharacterized protein n=1 Tax=Cyprideis torosa TaxID=163714 RepID=A0A7R8W451_9CRUS|nr:unnamed protein product [Cyprideis torosa]CAG0880286.1 unnamed protein product [Cyprideis torosa]